MTKRKSLTQNYLSVAHTGDLSPVIYRDTNLNLKNNAPSVHKLHDWSIEARKTVEPFIHELAGYIGLSPGQSTSRIKTAASIAEKTKRKYGDDFNKVCDTLGTRQFFDSADDLEKIMHTFKPGFQNQPFFKEWEDTVKIGLVENYYSVPALFGYRGMNIVLTTKLSNGQSLVNETQFMAKAMKDTDQLSHEVFEVVRRLRTKSSGGNELSTKEKLWLQDIIDLNRKYYDQDSKKLDLDKFLHPLWDGHKPVYTLPWDQYMDENAQAKNKQDLTLAI